MTTWMEKLAEFPDIIRKIVEAEIAEAHAAGRDYTQLRPLFPDEPVILNGCSAWGWDKEAEKHVRCREPVTHVRYMVGIGHGRPTYYCAEGSKHPFVE